MVETVETDSKDNPNNAFLPESLWVVVEAWGRVGLGQTPIVHVDSRVDVIVVVVSAVDRGRDDNALWKISLRLESHHVGAVLDNLNFAGVDVDVAILADDTAVWVPGLKLERTVLCFVPVSVAAVLIVPEQRDEIFLDWANRWNLILHAQSKIVVDEIVVIIILIVLSPRLYLFASSQNKY